MALKYLYTIYTHNYIAINTITDSLLQLFFCFFFKLLKSFPYLILFSIISIFRCVHKSCEITRSQLYNNTMPRTHHLSKSFSYILYLSHGIVTVSGHSIINSPATLTAFYYQFLFTFFFFALSQQGFGLKKRKYKKKDNIKRLSPDNC